MQGEEYSHMKTTEGGQHLWPQTWEVEAAEIFESQPGQHKTLSQMQHHRTQDPNVYANKHTKEDQDTVLSLLPPMLPVSLPGAEGTHTHTHLFCMTLTAPNLLASRA